MSKSPLHHSGDAEKGQAGGGGLNAVMRDAPTSGPSLDSALSRPSSKMQAFIQRIESLAGFEARGIRRVEPNEKQHVGRMGYVQIVLLWVSINLAANNITLGMLGPSVFALSFLDASLCATFGAILGSLPTAYTATWGPISGNRTMVRAPSLILAMT